MLGIFLVHAHFTTAKPRLKNTFPVQADDRPPDTGGGGGTHVTEAFFSSHAGFYTSTATVVRRDTSSLSKIESANHRTRDKANLHDAKSLQISLQKVWQTLVELLFVLRGRAPICSVDVFSPNNILRASAECADADDVRTRATCVFAMPDSHGSREGSCPNEVYRSERCTIAPSNGPAVQCDCRNISLTLPDIPSPRSRPLSLPPPLPLLEQISLLSPPKPLLPRG